MTAIFRGGPLDGLERDFDMPLKAIGKRPVLVWPMRMDYLYESLEEWDGSSDVLMEHTGTVGRKSLRVVTRIDGGGL